MRFDPSTHVFDFSYTPRAAGGPTEVFVPARHYPGGYVVDVKGGHVISAPNATILKLLADQGATRVDVDLRPGVAKTAAGGPPSANPSPPGGTSVEGRRLAATGSSFPWEPVGGAAVIAALAALGVLAHARSRER